MRSLEGGRCRLPGRRQAQIRRNLAMASRNVRPLVSSAAASLVVAAVGLRQLGDLGGMLGRDAAHARPVADDDVARAHQHAAARLPGR